MTSFSLTLIVVLLVIVLLVTEVSFSPIHGNQVAITTGSSLLSSKRLKLSAELAYALYGGLVRPANNLSDAQSSQLLNRKKEPNSTRSEHPLDFQHRKDRRMILPTSRNLKTQYQAEESHRESTRVMKKTGTELHHFNTTSSYPSTHMVSVQRNHKLHLAQELGKTSSSSTTYDKLKKNSILSTNTNYPSDSTVKRKTEDIRGETPALESVSRTFMELELDEEDIGKFKIKKMVLGRQKHKKHKNNTENSSTHAKLLSDSLEPKWDNKDIAKYKARDMSLLQQREYDQKDIHSISSEKISATVRDRSMTAVSKKEIFHKAMAGKANEVKEEEKEEEEGGDEENEFNDGERYSTDEGLLVEQDELTNKMEANILDGIKNVELNSQYKTKPNTPSEIPELPSPHKSSIIKTNLTARATDPRFKMPCPKVYRSTHKILSAPWMKPLLNILNSVEGRQVTLVIANSLYKDVLLNWLISAITCKPPIENIVVVCLDRMLHHILIARDIPAILAPFNSLLNINYKFRRFFDLIMMMRLGFMRIINRLGYDCAMYDIDAIIIKNPQTLYNKYNNSGIIGSRGSLPKSLMKMWKVTICIGAVFIRSSDDTGRFSLFISVFQ